MLLAELRPLVDDTAGWVVLLGAAATGIATAGKVWRTCLRVIRWMDRQEARWDAVDAWVQDWDERGITPRGAIEEAKKYRDLTDAHTSALADHKARLDEHDDRFRGTDEKLDHMSARVDEIAVNIRKAT